MIRFQEPQLSRKNEYSCGVIHYKKEKVNFFVSRPTIFPGLKSLSSSVCASPSTFSTHRLALQDTPS